MNKKLYTSFIPTHRAAHNRKTGKEMGANSIDIQ